MYKGWVYIKVDLFYCIKMFIILVLFFFIGKLKFGVYFLLDVMLKDLKERCLNLKEIYLKNCNIMNLDFSLLFLGLVKLMLENCVIELGLMKYFIRDLLELFYLDVFRIVRFDDRELSYVCGID